MSVSIRIHALFNEKSKKFVAGRKNLFDELPDLEEKRVVWFHCASLGEFDQGLPLMRLIKENQPETYLFVTFFSPSGYEHYMKRDHPVDFATYMPIDTPSKAKYFVQKLNPQAVFFVKYEFWLNHIYAAKEVGARVYNISGLFRNNHRFFKWYGSIFRSALKKFDHLYVQNENSKSLLNRIGLDNVTVTGDARFDQVFQNKNKSTLDSRLESFKSDKNVVVIGSSWPKDEKVILSWINSTDNRVLIAPHDISKKNIAQLEKNVTRKCLRFSLSTMENVNSADVLILDSIGHLSSAYRIGVASYVGGGFSGSLHNILEPAVYGLPVIFGPKHARFPEAQHFIDASIGFSISNSFEFEQTMAYILKNQEAISKESSQFVAENVGASQAIYDTIRW